MPSDQPNSRVRLTVLDSQDKLQALRSAMANDSSPPSPRPIDADARPKTIEQKLLEGRIIAALREIYDPEIPVNIYDLGLVYGIDIGPDNAVRLRMTLTAPNCPVAESLPAAVESKIQTIPQVPGATVEIVWDPPWDRSMMSEAARLELGM
jgi:FeS assembly SUF system protein